MNETHVVIGATLHRTSSMFAVGLGEEEEVGEEAIEHTEDEYIGTDTQGDTTPVDMSESPLLLDEETTGMDEEIPEHIDMSPNMGERQRMSSVGQQPMPMLDNYPMDDGRRQSRPANAWGQPPQSIPPYPLSPEWQAYNNYYRQQPAGQQFPPPPLPPPLLPTPPPPTSHVPDYWMFRGVPEFQHFYDKNALYAPSMPPRLPAPPEHPGMTRYPGNMAEFPDRQAQQPMRGPPEQMYPRDVPPIGWGSHDAVPRRPDPYDMPPDRRDPYDMSPDRREPYGMSPDRRDPYGMPPDRRDPYSMPPDRRDPYDRPPDRRDPYDRSPDRRDPYDRPPDRRDPYGRPPDRRDTYDMYPDRRDPYASDDEERRRGRRRAPRRQMPRDRPVEDEVIYYEDSDDLRDQLLRLIDSDDSIRYDDDTGDTDTRRRRRSSSNDTDDRYDGSGKSGSRGPLQRYPRKDPNHRRYRRLL